MKNLLLLLLVLMCRLLPALAQSDAKESARDFGSNKLFIAGHATVTATMDSTQSNFSDADFSAIFLYQLSDKLFVESEIEIATGEGSAEFGLEHANLVWMFRKDMAFHAGRFVPHFGLYRGRLGEGFINRFPTDPVGFGDGGIGAMVETGFGLQGGYALGTSKMNYDLWVSNGPQLLTDSANAGQFDYEAYKENNKNKAIGGRIGFLPFSNSCLELGFSYEMANKTGDAYSDYEGVGVKMLAVDANFYHKIDAIKSTIRLTGEYKKQDVDNFDYRTIGTELADTSFINSNSSNAFYVSGSLRPSGFDNEVVRNFEIAYRYSQFTPPVSAPWGGVQRQRIVASINYWLKWNCVIKAAFQQETDLPDQVLIQMFYGF